MHPVHTKAGNSATLPGLESPNILVADDHALVRDALSVLLRNMFPHGQVVEASSFEEAAEVAATTDISLAIVDLMMPGPPWRDALPIIKRHLHQHPLVVLSGIEDKAVARTAIQLGASGYISKASTTHVMMGAIEHVMAGEMYIPPMLMWEEDEDLAPHARGRGDGASRRPLPLTARQAEVLCLLARGCSNKEIARTLDVAQGTVRLHVTAILKALGVTNRTEAALVAREAGLPLDPRSGRMGAQIAS